MAKRSIEQVIRDLRQVVLKMSAQFAEKLIDDEEITKDDKKHLKDMKAELKFIEGLHAQLQGKTGKEQKMIESSIVYKLKEMSTSIGEIVKSIKQ